VLHFSCQTMTINSPSIFRFYSKEGFYVDLTFPCHLLYGSGPSNCHSSFTILDRQRQRNKNATITFVDCKLVCNAHKNLILSDVNIDTLLKSRACFELTGTPRIEAISRKIIRINKYNIVADREGKKFK
jgi:hypothetical protein